ncbi:MAG: NUDIX hydrolase [Phototrophicales bacterium]|nr:MAG: hypothetical protein CUN56_10815 [Phototrophicales bacterium]RMG77585.1 MAG: NUDIX domain-containing protein [Chloroflexota bacterium]
MAVTNYCPACGTQNEYISHDGRLRPKCPACGYITYVDPKCAAIAFIVENDRLLLVQRAYDPGKGKWGLPGGFIEAGEDPKETARREALEETGLNIEITNLLDVFFVENGVITIAYAAKRLNGDLTAADDALDVRWFTRETLPELVFLSTITLCQRWVNHELG